MKKFEYKEMKWHYAGNLTERLNELGDEGWRVCGFTRPEGHAAADILLMREKGSVTQRRKPLAPGGAVKERMKTR